MSVIDPSDLTFNGEEIKALSEAILSDYYEKPTIQEFHTLVSGIEAKKQIAVLGLLGLVGKKVTSCTADENESQIPMSEKFWEPEPIGDRFVQCWTDLRNSFFIYGTKAGVNKADLTNTDFANFLSERLGDAMTESVFRHAWFGDTDAANYNSSPAGVITNGVDVDYFNVIDGLWKQVFAIVAGNSAQKIAITKNAGANYADQKFDSTDITNEVITNVMQQMIDDADTTLTSSNDVVFVCTKSVADQYKRERKKATGIDAAYQRVENGISMLQIDGITIYVFEFWDRMIKSYFNNGTKYYLPHRILLYPKSNVQVGTENESTLSELDAFYDKKSKTYNVDFQFNLDAKIIEDLKIMAAY